MLIDSTAQYREKCERTMYLHILVMTFVGSLHIWKVLPLRKISRIQSWPKAYRSWDTKLDVIMTQYCCPENLNTVILLA